MSFSSAIFQADDLAIAGIGALMETRSLATNKLYYFSAQFAGDTEQALREDTDHQSPAPDLALINGGGAPLKVKATRDSEGRITAMEIVRADDSPVTFDAGPPPVNPYTIDTATGLITHARGGRVGYVELHPLEGGALSQVQVEINDASAVITTFSNLIAANKQALKSVLNVIR